MIYENYKDYRRENVCSLLHQLNDNWNQGNMHSLKVSDIFIFAPFCFMQAVAEQTKSLWKLLCGVQQEDTTTMNFLYKGEASYATDAAVLALLHRVGNSVHIVYLRYTVA